MMNMSISSMIVMFGSKPKSVFTGANLCITLMFLLNALNSAKANNNVNILANVCYPGTFTNEFAFAKPSVCINNCPGDIVKCEASISQPRTKEVEINAHACFKTIEG